MAVFSPEGGIFAVGLSLCAASFCLCIAIEGYAYFALTNREGQPFHAPFVVKLFHVASSVLGCTASLSAIFVAVFPNTDSVHMVLAFIMVIGFLGYVGGSFVFSTWLIPWKRGNSWKTDNLASRGTLLWCFALRLASIATFVLGLSIAISLWMAGLLAAITMRSIAEYLAFACVELQCISMVISFRRLACRWIVQQVPVPTAAGAGEDT